MPLLLYVDDEETIGRAVARWFERRGHVVHLAHSVDEAKRVLLHHSPDAIFIDVWLGTESGFELMSWIEDVRAPLADRVTFDAAHERAKALVGVAKGPLRPLAFGGVAGAGEEDVRVRPRQARRFPNRRSGRQNPAP